LFDNSSGGVVFAPPHVRDGKASHGVPVNAYQGGCPIPFQTV